MEMNEFDELLELLIRFRDERDWEQFHDSKNLALALSIEVAELNELFLWKKDQESEAVDREKLKEELADVFAYAILLAGKHDLNIGEIVREKIDKNREKLASKLGPGAPASGHLAGHSAVLRNYCS